MSAPLTSVRDSPCWHYSSLILRRPRYKLTVIVKQIIRTSQLGDTRKTADISNQISAMTWLTESNNTLLTCPNYLFSDIVLWHHLTDTLCRVRRCHERLDQIGDILAYITRHTERCQQRREARGPNGAHGSTRSPPRLGSTRLDSSFFPHHCRGRAEALRTSRVFGRFSCAISTSFALWSCTQ